MKTISLERAIDDGVISKYLVEDLETELDKQDILIYVAIKYYGYEIYELCEMLPNLDRPSILNSFKKTITFLRTNEMFGFSHSMLGWADSTRFRN